MEPEELERIRSWPIPDWQRAREMMAFAERRWCRDHGGSSYWDTAKGFVTLRTGDDAVNLELLDALQGNELFWKLCWERSERGGVYVFRVVPR